MWEDLLQHPDRTSCACIISCSNLLEDFITPPWQSLAQLVLGQEWGGYWSVLKAHGKQAHALQALASLINLWTKTRVPCCVTTAAMSRSNLNTSRWKYSDKYIHVNSFLTMTFIDKICKCFSLEMVLIICPSCLVFSDSVNNRMPPNESWLGQVGCINSIY